MERRQSDESCMQGYQEGNGEAFAELYRRYQGRVFAYLRHKGLSTEAADEVFQNIWSKLHQTRFRYELKFKFAAWLFTLARSVLIDYWRKEKKFAAQRTFEEGRHAKTVEVAESEDVNIAWERISEQDRQSLKWRYLDEASFEEIAERLGLQPSNVRKRISRALKKLKQFSKKVDE